GEQIQHIKPIHLVILVGYFRIAIDLELDFRRGDFYLIDREPAMKESLSYIHAIHIKIRNLNVENGGLAVPAKDIFDVTPGLGAEAEATNCYKIFLGIK